MLPQPGRREKGQQNHLAPRVQFHPERLFPKEFLLKFFKTPLFVQSFHQLFCSKVQRREELHSSEIWLYVYRIDGLEFEVSER